MKVLGVGNSSNAGNEKGTAIFAVPFLCHYLAMVNY